MNNQILTEKEIGEIYRAGWRTNLEFARAIEKKVLEKISNSSLTVYKEPKEEPVAWVYNGILHEFDPSEFATSEVTPLYTKPPKREWVGLTEYQRLKFADKFHISEEVIKAIEDKLKEKNT